MWLAWLGILIRWSPTFLLEDVGWWWLLWLRQKGELAYLHSEKGLFLETLLPCPLQAATLPLWQG